MTSSKDLKTLNLSMILLGMSVIGCSNDKAMFSSGLAEMVLSERSSDGITSQISSEQLFGSDDAKEAPQNSEDSSENEDDASAADSAPQPAELESKDLEPQVTEAEELAPTTASEEASPEKAPNEKAKNEKDSSEVARNDKAAAEHAPHENASEEKGAGSKAPADKGSQEAPKPEMLSPAVLDFSTESVSECAKALGLKPETKASDFRSELVTKVKNEKLKNMNHQVLFRDPPSESPKPLFLQVRVKNANHSSLELLDPKGLYCVDFKAKNMNKFNFKFHCDAKVVFVNFEHKKDKKAKTVRLQCK